MPLITPYHMEMLKVQRVAAVMLKTAVGVSSFYFLWLLFVSPKSRPFQVAIHEFRPSQGMGRFLPPLQSDGPIKDGYTPLVWQKTSTKSFSENIKSDLPTWRRQNPFFAFVLLDDEQSDAFVSQEFAYRPDIVDLYLSLRIPIVKADLFRYLVLYAKGGVWADLDVACEKSVDDWVPREYLATANLVVVIEGVQAYRGSRAALGSQFTSWVVMAKPKSPHLLYVIDSIVESMKATAAEYGVGYEGIELGMISDVVDVTGPYKMTLGIVKSLSSLTRYGLDDRDLTNIKAPLLVGDVLIMPGEAFAASQNEYPRDQDEVLVTHHYAGSWKEEANKARKQRFIAKKIKQRAAELKRTGLEDQLRY